MKSFIRIFFSILSVVCWLHSPAQETTPSVNTIRVKKKVPASPEEIGARFFKLYCAGKLDTLMMEFYPTQEIALELCRQGNAASSDNELYSYVQNDFEEMKNNFLFEMTKNFESAKEHGVCILKIDSIKYDYPDSDGWKAGTNWKLLTIGIYLSSETEKYDFYIYPLYGYLDKWYVFATEYHFQQRQE